MNPGTALTRLDLHDNPMTEDVADALADALRAQRGLRCLNLTDTGLGDEGVATIASAIADCCPDLEELHLELNEITAAGAAALASALPRLPALRILDLKENELEDEGAIALAPVRTRGGVWLGVVFGFGERLFSRGVGEQGAEDGAVGVLTPHMTWCSRSSHSNPRMCLHSAEPYTPLSLSPSSHMHRTLKLPP